MSEDNGVDGVDHDATMLAVRTLVERVRDTRYADGVTPPALPQWWRYALEDREAMQAVLDFTLSENTRTILRRNERYAQLLHCAMLRLCDHGETMHSSTLVREIHNLLGGVS